MATLSFPTIPAARVFPLAATARVFPLSAPSVVLTTSPYTVSTLSTLLGRIREQLIASFWSDAELTLYVQDGLRLWNTLTLYYREQESASFLASQPFYDMVQLIEDYMICLRIQNVTYTLEPISIEEIGAYIPAYQSTTATVVPKQWIPMGLNLIALYTQISVTNSMTVDYIRLAPVPSNLSDYVQLGEEDMSALIDFVVFMAHLKEGGSELTTAVPRMQNFLKQAAKYNSKLLNSGIYRKMIGMAAGGQPNQRPDDLDRTPTR